MRTRTSYYVRVGRPRARRAQTYQELLALGERARIRHDDGAIAGPWITTADAEWPWNEGPCPCGGVMRWAEAGYVPWHRICDRCGSHWDLHPLTFLPTEGPPRGVLLPIADPPGAQLVDRKALDDIYRRAYALVRPEHITDGVLGHGALYGGWARRARFYCG